MSDDYLWDGSGPPDLEVARLERQLAPLRYRHRPLRHGSRMAWALAGQVCVGTVAGIAVQLGLAVGLIHWFLPLFHGSLLSIAHSVADSDWMLPLVRPFLH